MGRCQIIDLVIVVNEGVKDWRTKKGFVLELMKRLTTLLIVISYILGKKGCGVRPLRWGSWIRGFLQYANFPVHIELKAKWHNICQERWLTRFFNSLSGHKLTTLREKDLSNYERTTCTRTLPKDWGSITSHLFSHA